MCVCEIERLLFSWVMRPWQRFVSLSVLKLADVSDCARETANRRAEERGLEEREKKKNAETPPIVSLVQDRAHSAVVTLFVSRR